MFEYVCYDPLLGDLSCDDADHAIELAKKVDGQPFMLTWKNCKVIKRSPIYSRAASSK